MANRSLGSLTLDLVAKIGGFTSGMRQAANVSEKEIKRIEKSYSSLGKTIGRAINLVAAGAIYRAIIKNTIEAEQAQLRLERVLETTGNKAGFTAKQLSDYAEEIQRTTTVEDDAARAGIARLAQFGNVRGEIFTGAVAASLDLAADKGIEFASAVEIVGKALNNPAKAYAALAKQGIVFTDAQKKVHKQLLATGEGIRVQTEFLNALKETSGGAAEALTNTLGGSLTQLKNTIGNLLEGDAGSGLNGLTTSIKTLNETLNDPRVREGFQQIIQGIFGITQHAAQAIGLLVELDNRVRLATAEGDISRLFVDDASREVDAIARRERARGGGIPKPSSISPAPFVFGGTGSGKPKVDKEAEKLKRAIDAARKSLQGMTLDLQTQIATFDMSEAAVLKYRLSFGDLSEGIKLLGPEGEKLKAQISGLADQFQRLQDTKAIQEGLRGVNQELLSLAGDTAGAALAAFNEQYKELEKLLQESPTGAAGLAQVESLRQATVAQAQFNKELEKVQKIQTDIDRQEEKIRRSVELGSLTRIEGLQELDKLHLQEIGRLEEVRAELLKIVSAMNIPEGVKQQMLETIAAIGDEISRVKDETGEFARSINNDMQDAFEDSFAELIQGTKTLKEAFNDFIADISAQFAKLAAQQVADQLFGAIGMGGSGGVGGIIAAWVSGKAMGGPVMAGTPYVVGEKGPELFIPRTSGMIEPNLKGMGGFTQYNTIKIDAPDGNISRRSLSQLRTELGRSVQVDMSRNT